MVFATKICNPDLNRVLTAQMFKKHPKQHFQFFLGLDFSIFLIFLSELQAEQEYFWNATVAWCYPSHTD